jgi:hypothetical protein
MKNTERFAELQSPDPVIREMALMANRIMSDVSLTKSDRAHLIHRLEVEYHAYKAWKSQYAGYFRTPRLHRGKRENIASNGRGDSNE